MRRMLLLGVALAGVPGMAWAQVETRPLIPAGGWTVTVGIEGRVLPRFIGSDRYLLAPFPIINIREAGTPWLFAGSRDGFSAAILEAGRFRFGPTAKIALARRVKDDPALRGLGDVDWAFELGAFAEYWPLDWLRTRAELRQGFGGHHGVIADLSVDAVMQASPTLTLSAGPRLTLATAEALRPYFGIDAAQSIASGLPAYQPDSGARSVGVGAQAHQQWSKQWATNVYLEYERLVGDAARSPIVSSIGSPNQVTFGLGVTYSFDVSLR